MSTWHYWNVGKNTFTLFALVEGNNVKSTFLSDTLWYPNIIASFEVLQALSDRLSDKGSFMGKRKIEFI